MIMGRNMNLLSQEQVEQYKNDGYLLVKNIIPLNAIKDVIDAVAYTIELELLAQGKTNYDKSELLHKELINLKREKPKSSSWIYQTINASWNLKKLLALPEIEQAVMDLLNVDTPLKLGTVSPAIRFDIPGDTRNVRTWHQDSSYFLECKRGEDALVVWLPLNKATKENGSVIMCPGTHKNGRFDNRHEAGGFGVKSEQYTTPEHFIEGKELVYVEAEAGDIAFINMDLIHSSGVNVSDMVRYTAQIRFNNISVPEYRPVFLRPEYPEYER